MFRQYGYEENFSIVSQKKVDNNRNFSIKTDTMDVINGIHCSELSKR